MSFPRNYVLRLFVAGATARSRQAVLCVRKMCDAELKRGCKLEVVDIYQQPSLARRNQIVATPTLIKEFPRPVRRFIGSLSKITGLFGEPDLGSEHKSRRLKTAGPHSRANQNDPAVQSGPVPHAVRPRPPRSNVSRCGRDARDPRRWFDSARSQTRSAEAA